MARAKIQCAGAYLPKRKVTNDDLSQLVDTSDEWIVTRTGIHSRFVSAGENASDMAAAVCEQLLEKSGLSPLDIDMILISTVTADYATPSTACIVQGKIGAHNAFCFDINAACSGFLYGMSVAEKMIATGRCRNAIVVGAEVLSKIVDWEERSTCVLFGDGAGGVLLTQAEDGGILGENLFSDGRQHTAILGGHKPVRNPFADTEEAPGEATQFIQMDGRALFDFTTHEVPKSIQSLLEATDTAESAVQWFVLHQANDRIVRAIAKKLKYDYDKFYVNIGRVGNTSSATIPIALSEMLGKGILRIGSGEKIVLSAFGGGVTWGSMLIQI